MSNNVKAIKNNFGARKMLFDDGNIVIRHVHGNHFNLLSNSSLKVDVFQLSLNTRGGDMKFLCDS